MTDNLQRVKDQFERDGISIAEWARENGYKVRTVYAILNGELKCKRGISHKIAVSLGIKRHSVVVGK